MKAKVIEKQWPMSLYDIIRFQINTHCFLNSIRISPAQLDTLAYLGMWGDMNISDFCEQIAAEEIFGTPQTVRNFVTKCVKDKLIYKKGMGKKIISLSDDFKLINNGTILINMKVYHVDKEQ
ncbi:MAG: hypothetical protein GTN59_07645 [Candidatus Dadabacteria bacterium]|nr:hypothetical protein [Candidatus Dadabacteria bacterium]